MCGMSIQTSGHFPHNIEGKYMSFLRQLKLKNEERQREWDACDKVDDFYRLVEFVGEVGELCNNIKKTKREEIGLIGSRCTREELESEFGDVMITFALLANEFNIDIEEVTKTKFNETSEKLGLQTYFDRYVVSIISPTVGVGVTQVHYAYSTRRKTLQNDKQIIDLVEKTIGDNCDINSLDEFKKSLKDNLKNKIRSIKIFDTKTNSKFNHHTIIIECL